MEDNDDKDVQDMKLSKGEDEWKGRQTGQVHMHHHENKKYLFTKKSPTPHTNTHAYTGERKKRLRSNSEWDGEKGEQDTGDQPTER